MDLKKRTSNSSIQAIGAVGFQVSAKALIFHCGIRETWIFWGGWIAAVPMNFGECPFLQTSQKGLDLHARHGASQLLQSLEEWT
jgi:hypothetical protein